MIGIPVKRTLIERVLAWLGWVGAGLGLLLLIGSLVSLLAYPMGLFLAPYIFAVGATGVVAGLGMVALAQGLGSLRLIANHTKKSGSPK